MRPYLVVLLALGALPSRAVAQAPAPPDARSDDASDEAARRAVEAALDRPLTYDLGETAVGDLMASVQRFVGAPCVVHPDVSLDAVVTFVADGVPLRAALGRALEGTGLQLRVWGGALLVVPAGKDLGSPPDGAALRGRPASLKATFLPMPLGSLITNVRASAGLEVAVAADARAIVDRAALHVVFDDPLPLARALTLITHPFGLTWRVDGDAVHIVRRGAPAAERASSRPPPKHDDPVAAFVARAETRIRAALEGGTDRLTEDMDRLHEVIGELARHRGLIVVRHVNVRDDKRVKFRARPGQALGAALDEALHGARLEARVFHGALVIVPRGVALGEPPLLPDGARLAMQRVTFQPMWGKLPLADVLRELQERTGVTIQVARDAQALVDKVETDFELADVPLPVALTLVTHAGGITWTFDGQQVQVIRRR